MLTVTTVAELRARVREWRGAGETIGLVPTMGALHAGHISLVRRAKKQATRACATIFVNPTQFGPNEDFSRYPRTPDADAALLGAEWLKIPPCDLGETSVLGQSCFTQQVPVGIEHFAESPTARDVLSFEQHASTWF